MNADYIIRGLNRPSEVQLWHDCRQTLAEWCDSCGKLIPPRTTKAIPTAVLTFEGRFLCPSCNFRAEDPQVFNDLFR